jgi:NAD(P)-dependent dehydrogenase (short-subunit alcohol dehydrogenase family)
MAQNDTGARVTLITGSSRGIGKAMAIAFAEHGDQVIVHGTREHENLASALEAARGRNPSAVARAADLTKPSEIADMFDWIEAEFGRLDVLINNAAVQNDVPLLDMPEEDWDRVLGTNLKAPFLCTQRAGRMMRNQGGGKIINLGSVHEMAVRGGFTHYCVAKGGLLMLTKNSALELSAYNIQVNQIAAGAIATEMTDASRQDLLLSAIPSNRIGAPEEIASIAIFLASSDADYITGASLLVDGGMTLGFAATRRDL